MPEFISKVQYKNCEDGEYYDEKSRDLQRTLELINNYPWEKEQYADLDLTGPSVTISNEKGNYLRLGIYYGGRFTLHYLDTKHHYYKKKNIAFEAAINAVSDFFADRLSLDGFEKNAFSFFESYFKTKRFEYRVSFWKASSLMITWLIFFAIFLSFAIFSVFNPKTKAAWPASVAALIFAGIILVNIFKIAHRRGQYLRISRGHNKFLFGDGSDGIKEFDKEDIAKLTTYDNYSNRRYNKNHSMFEVFEIDFTDGSFICFNNTLISGTTLDEKFSNKWKFDREKIGLNRLDLFDKL